MELEIVEKKPAKSERRKTCFFIAKQKTKDEMEGK